MYEKFLTSVFALVKKIDFVRWKDTLTTLKAVLSDAAM